MKSKNLEQKLEEVSKRYMVYAHSGEHLVSIRVSELPRQIGMNLDGKWYLLTKKGWADIQKNQIEDKSVVSKLDKIYDNYRKLENCTRDIPEYSDSSGIHYARFKKF